MLLQKSLLKISVSKKKLIQHAASYVSHLKVGLPILLEGDLGVGKTTWVRALLQAAISKDLRVSSPTFSLMVPYTWNEKTIWHMDLYRLESNPHRVKDLCIAEYLRYDICLIEWPVYLSHFFPLEYISVRLSYTKLSENRILEVLHYVSENTHRSDGMH